MRDWLKAFRPASFRGVPFKVEVENATGGRRLSIHPIAYADQSVIEDMGRDPHRFSVTAYVVGDVADASAKALMAALAVKGAGALILPMLGAIGARVASWSLDRQKTYAGYVGFDIEFVEEGLASVPFNAMAGAGAIGGMFAAGASAIGAALARLFSGRSAGEVAADLVHGSIAADAARAVASIASDGVTPAADVEAALAALAGASTAMQAKPAAWAEASAEVWRLIGMRCAAAALRRELASPPVAVTSNAAAATLAFRAGALALATVRDAYAAQPDAGRARGALATAVEPVLADAALWLGDEASAWVASVTGEAALMLSAGQASRTPLVAVETPQSMSAIRAAYDLYGDAARAGEIVARNMLGDPVFLPVRFEALAS